MTTINNLLELYSLKGNVISGKIILFNDLEKQNMNETEIKSKVVDEFQIMGKKHFVRCWKEYQKIKRFMTFNTNE